MAKSRGFTLIEVMVVVAIVAILAAIAIPSYQEHLRKGRRAEAQAFLTQVAQRQQQYLMDARTYALGGGAITALNLTPPTSVSNFYTITVSPDAPTQPPSFTVFAAPKAGTAQATDGTLSINEQGAKTRDVGGTDKGW